MRIPAVAVLVLGSCLVVPQASADPSDATVFISLVGRVRVLSGGDRLRAEVLLELPQVEVGTGSGFMISPEGWVLTNHHVITGGRINAVIDGIPVVIAVDVERIDVAIPGVGSTGGGARRYTASVYASDPELDLAVLSIGGSNFPHVSLGDSDAVTAGETVSALGYPFGRELELGKSGQRADVPTVSMNGGTVSAIRRNEAGEIRFIQTSAQLNPGNSGGPIVDADGYAIAVAQLTVRGSTGIGFGVPINVVKAYLRRLGLDRTLPVGMVTLGPLFDDDVKGIRLRLPDGFQDAATSRLRVEAGAFGYPVVLRIDRIAASPSPEQVESALIANRTFERFQASGPTSHTTRRESGATMIAGFVRGTNDGGPASMQYAIVRFGQETVVARYVGHADAMAISRAVFRDSLAEIAVRPLLTEPAQSKPGWLNSSLVPSPSPATPSLPAGWHVEPGAPSGCSGLPSPTQAVSASPVGDFTVAFRAAAWPGPSIDAARAARGCAALEAAGTDRYSYSSRAPWWGTPYAARGLLVPTAGGGLMQLELVAPEASVPAVMPLFDAWVRSISRQ